jgi:hypothetical protein
MFRLGSALVILAAPVLILAWDALAYLRDGNAATISHLSLQTAWEYPPYRWSVCWLFGLLVAHLFIHGDHRPLPVWLAVAVAVVVPLLVAFATLVMGLRTPDSAVARACRAAPLLDVLLWLNLGCLAGARLLAQTGD